MSSQHCCRQLSLYNDNKVRTEIFAVFFGVISSVLTTAATRLLQQYLERKEQREVSRRQARGLLELMLMRAEYAANYSEMLDLEPLVKLMTEEPLYATLDRHSMAEAAQELWEASESHNHGLTKPDGLQRSARLQEATDQLRADLWRLRNLSSS